MTRFAISIVLIGSAIATVLPSAGWADARGDFAAHRALYKMKMGHNKNGSDVTDVEGRMAFEWRQDCDGWSVEQRYVMRFFGASGDARDVVSSYTTWESKDGSAYHFLVKKDRSGGSEEIRGSADKQGEGGRDAGTAAFTAPEAKEFQLSAQTMFPSAHTFALLNRARDGERFFAARIFDGGEFEGETPVTAAIGRPNSKPSGRWPILNQPYWPIRLAFFDANSDSAEPSYEMEIALHGNGIARYLVLDYGDFTVDVKLDQLELLDDGSC